VPVDETGERGHPEPLRTAGWRGKRRGVLIIGLAGAVVAAAAVTAVVLVTAKPGPQKYASLPGPCALVTTATLAQYVPGAASTVQSTPSSGTHQVDSCDWAAISGYQARQLLVTIDLYRSSSGVADARRTFSPHATAACKCAVTVRSITGLGDEAKTVLITFDKNAFPKGGRVIPPEAAVVVQSGNVSFQVFYNVTIYNPQRPGPPVPAPAVEQAAAVAGAHDVLAALADPGAARPGAPPVRGPDYPLPAKPCGLVTTATLATMLSKAQAGPTQKQSNTVSDTEGCGWQGQTTALTLNLSVTIFHGVARIEDAHSALEYQIQVDSQDSADGRLRTATTKTEPVPGVGSQGTAVFQDTAYPDESGLISYRVELLAWSGNALIVVRVNGFVGATDPPTQATALRYAIAVARDTLTALPGA
jgi:hypothetical protein